MILSSDSTREDQDEARTMRRPIVMMRPEPGETKEHFKRRFAEALRAAAAETRGDSQDPEGAAPDHEGADNSGHDDPDQR